MKTNFMKIFRSFTLCALFLSTCFAVEMPAKKQDHPIALVGGTVHTVSGPVLQNATIVFDNGKITALGTNATVPANAEKIDVTGKHVYPGMIDASTDLGLIELDAVRATRDLSETGNINPNIHPEVSFNPESELIPVTRANGVTLAGILPNGGVICGTLAVMEMDGWTWEDMTFKAPAGLVINWPNMTINHGFFERRSDEDQKKERDRQLNMIRDAFKDARAYWKAKDAESGKDIPHHNTDSRWEAMAPFLKGEAPVVVVADEVTQIEAAVAWAEQEGVKLVILGAYDAWRVTDLLKAKNVSVIVTPILRTPYRRSEAYDDPMTLPQKLSDAKVQFCISTDDGNQNQRNLPYHAAMAASYGLSKEEALKSVTLYPAQILGISDRVGTLEVGKNATLIVTTGDPLEISTNVEKEFIDGRNISLSSRHTRLYEKYKEKYSRINGGK